MDRVAGTGSGLTQAAVRWNFDAIKEPRGFLKLIQIVIAIFAFATTTSNSSDSSFSFNCNTTVENAGGNLSWSYPFRLNNQNIKLTFCNGSADSRPPFGDFGAASQFYVFVGVMAFLYSIAAIVLYVCFDDKYREIDKIPTADFFASCVFVLMWLISASAWASGVAHVKLYTNPKEWALHIVPECAPENACTVNDSGNFATLNVSLMFGFLNMGLWAANLWFLYKETKWFNPEPQQPETSSPTEPQQRI